MPDMLSAALAYAAKGLAVIPLQGKIPRTEHGSHDASADPDQVRSWWSRWPDANIGIATGRTGGKLALYVIDADEDQEHKKFGLESVQQWERRNGELPRTCTVRTGRGGRHYYYIDNIEHPNANDIIEDVDIRGEGGYVVAPPSVHPDTGQLYEWENHSILDGGASAATDIVRRFLGTKKEKSPEEIYKITEKIPDGKRTTAMVSLLGKCVDIGLSQEETRAMIRMVNENRCEHPLTDKELEKEVFKAFTHGWVARHPFTDETEDTRILPEPRDLSDIWSEPPAMKPVLIEDVLRQGHKMIISAPSKAGKSFALMELAFSIAEGFNWFGSRCRQGRVLYINMEIDDESFYNRFKMIYKAYGKDNDNHVENLTVWGLRGFSMPLSKLAPLIIQQAKHDYIAIIIDPLYKVMDGDENSNSDVSQMVSQFDRIARETGAAVIYAHHFAKGIGGDKAAIDRGAGAGTFARDPDAILTMVQLDMPEQKDKSVTAWRMEYVLREFPNKEPVSFWWKYPLHEMDDDLEEAEIETTVTRTEKTRKKTYSAKLRAQIDNTKAAAELVADSEGKFTLSKFIEAYAVYEDVPRSTAQRRLQNAGYESLGSERAGAPAYWKKA